MVTRRGQITRAVTEALKDAPLLSRDGAAVALVKRYAVLLDESEVDPEVVGDLGPKLLRALESLGLTPAGRGTKGEPGAPTVAGQLDELRARRAKRAGQHDT